MELVGRDAEARELAELLGERGSRLISLSGTPGVGKTALTSIIPTLVPAGTAVWSVDVAGAPSGADLLGEIARELGLSSAAPSKGTRAPLARLAAMIGGARVVLVVDHADLCAIDESTLQSLLGRCAGLSLVVVAATPLGGSGSSLRVGPLRVSPPYARWEEVVASPSARLFAQRAERVSAGFRLDATTAPTVAEICRLVDGLPLAIELAAARSGILSIDRLARELRADGSALDALDLLTSRSGGPQGALRDALTSTRQHLTPREDTLFTRVGAFRGPFTFDAAVGVARAPAGEVLDDLAVLVDLRLIEPSGGDRWGPIFSMLPLVRAFAREKSAPHDLDYRGRMLRELTRSAAVAVAHAASSTAVHDVRVMRADVGDEIRRLAEVDLSAAVGMAVDAASVLGGYTGTSSIIDVLEAALTSQPLLRADPAQAARVWLWASNVLAYSADGFALRDRVRERWRRGMELVDPIAEPHLALQARLIAVLNGSTTGDLAVSVEAADEGRLLAEELALPTWLARFEVCGAALAHARGDVSAAVALGTSGLRRGQRVADPLSVAGATVVLRTTPPSASAHAVSAPELEDALEICREHRDPMAKSFVLAALTQRDLLQGEAAAAARWCLRRLATGRRNGWSHLTAVSLVHAALIGAAIGDFIFAARMMGAVDADEERTVHTMTPAVRGEYEKAQGVVADRLGAAHVARLAASGALLAPGDAVAEAIRWLEDHSHAESPVIRPGPGRITAREHDVLELLSAGLTNKQIAEQLSLSVKTVMHHSVAIYRKLGVRGRAEATATAYRYDLLSARPQWSDA